MSTESAKPRTTKGNNTTISSTALHPESAAPHPESAAPESGEAPRGRRHEHIRTSDDQMKHFNKGYHAKAQSQYLDPCQAQTKASMKCMDDNNYDKRRCTRFFKDYSDCKRMWLESLREERRRKNLGIVDDNEIPEIKKDSASATNPSS